MNTAKLETPEEDSEPLPAKYDLREYGRVSEVRDQGSWGTCWAFAALSALESSLLPNQKWEFSVDHLAMDNGFNARLDDGGDYNMALAYMTSWTGPVTENRIHMAMESMKKILMQLYIFRMRSLLMRGILIRSKTDHDLWCCSVSHLFPAGYPVTQ